MRDLTYIKSISLSAGTRDRQREKISSVLCAIPCEAARPCPKCPVGQPYFVLEIVGSNFFWTRTRTRSIEVFWARTRTFYSFKMFFKFEAERRSEDTGCFYSITYLKTSTSFIFLREF
jgi:hypothetical protein